MSFSADVDAAIGSLVRAFGELEYVLGGLFMTLRELRHGERLADQETAEAKELEKILGFTIGQYIKPLEKEAAELGGEAQTTLTRLSGSLEELGEIRNIVCHGIWRCERAGDIVVYFWSRKALEALRESASRENFEFKPDQLKLNLQRINALREVVAQHSFEIIALRQSLRNEANKRK